VEREYPAKHKRDYGLAMKKMQRGTFDPASRGKVQDTNRGFHGQAKPCEMRATKHRHRRL
jgi:hypothetical protein